MILRRADAKIDLAHRRGFSYSHLWTPRRILVVPGFFRHFRATVPMAMEHCAYCCISYRQCRAPLQRDSSLLSGDFSTAAYKSFSVVYEKRSPATRFTVHSDCICDIVDHGGPKSISSTDLVNLSSSTRATSEARMAYYLLPVVASCLLIVRPAELLHGPAWLSDHAC